MQCRKCPFLVVGAVVASLTFGCSTTSTIYRHRGPPLEADVVAGSTTHVEVEADGQHWSVARSDVSEVDYPGNVHAIVGGVVLGYGLINIALGYERCTGDDVNGRTQTGFCVGMATPAAVGLGLLIWGLATNLAAQADFDDMSSLPPGTAPPVPPAPGYAPLYPQPLGPAPAPQYYYPYAPATTAAPPPPPMTPSPPPPSSAAPPAAPPQPMPEQPAP